MARPAPLVARSTATRRSREESPERPTRASRETDDGCRLRREKTDGEEIANISASFVTRGKLFNIFATVRR